MRLFKRISLITLSSTLLLLAGCGGSGGDSGAAVNTPTGTECVLGTSKIGECTI